MRVTVNGYYLLITWICLIWVDFFRLQFNYSKILPKVLFLKIKKNSNISLSRRHTTCPYIQKDFFPRFNFWKPVLGGITKLDRFCFYYTNHIAIFFFNFVVSIDRLMVVCWILISFYLSISFYFIIIIVFFFV